MLLAPSAISLVFTADQIQQHTIHTQDTDFVSMQHILYCNKTFRST